MSEAFVIWIANLIGIQLSYRDRDVHASALYLLITSIILFSFVYIPSCFFHFALKHTLKSKLFNYLMLSVRFLSGFSASVIFGVYIGMITLMTYWGRWYIGLFVLLFFWICCWIHFIRLDDGKNKPPPEQQQVHSDDEEESDDEFKVQLEVKPKLVPRTITQRLMTAVVRYPKTLLDGVKRYYGAVFVIGAVFILIAVSLFSGMACNTCRTYHNDEYTTSFTRKVLGYGQVCGL